MAPFCYNYTLINLYSRIFAMITLFIFFALSIIVMPVLCDTVRILLRNGNKISNNIISNSKISQSGGSTTANEILKSLDKKLSYSSNISTPEDFKKILINHRNIYKNDIEKIYLSYKMEYDIKSMIEDSDMTEKFILEKLEQTDKNLRHIKNEINFYYDNKNYGGRYDFDNYLYDLKKKRQKFLEKLKNYINSKNKFDVQPENSGIILLLKNIKDLADKLKTPEAESLSNASKEIFEIYNKVIDENYKNKAVAQLKLIDERLKYLVDKALIPGTESYFKNELKIKQHYLDSVIPKSSFDDINKK